ncbi:MAG: hypothetical protein NVS1B6_04360 [Steroidobacteraceae bacterium]
MKRVWLVSAVCNCVLLLLLGLNQASTARLLKDNARLREACERLLKEDAFLKAQDGIMKQADARLKAADDDLEAEIKRCYGERTSALGQESKGEVKR